MVSVSLADELAWQLRKSASESDRYGIEVTELALEIVERAHLEIARKGAQSVLLRPWWLTPSPVIVCEEFLAPRELADLRLYVMSRKDDFQPATLVSGESAKIYVDTDFRLSETFFDLGRFHSLFENRISHYLDFVCARLDRPAFNQPSFELQLTATRNGGFFRTHDDNSHPDNRTRRLTFVYYFYIESFRRGGGDLCFSPSAQLLTPLLISPIQNRLVFFDSSLRHEVKTFHSEFDKFEGARFTVNGWIHQDEWQ